MNALISEIAAEIEAARPRSNIQDICVSRSPVNARYELLESPGAAIPPPQRWHTSGFSVELHHLPPFSLKGDHNCTCFAIYFGPVVRRIAINSDTLQSDRLQAGDIEFLPAGTRTKAIAVETAPFILVVMTPERVAQLTDALFGDQPGYLQPRPKLRLPNARPLHRLLREYLAARPEDGTLYLEALLTVLATEVFRRAWIRAEPVPPARHSLAPMVRRRPEPERLGGGGLPQPLSFRPVFPAGIRQTAPPLCAGPAPGTRAPAADRHRTDHCRSRGALRLCQPEPSGDGVPQKLRYFAPTI
jgi:hypothetical protein